MSAENRTPVSLSAFASLLGAVAISSYAAFPVLAGPVDPDILPPEATIPYAMPPGSVPPVPQAAQQMPGAQGQVPGQVVGAQGAPGLGGVQLPTGPIMSRRGVPMNANGIITGGGQTGSPPGTAFSLEVPGGSLVPGNAATTLTMPGTASATRAPLPPTVVPAGGSENDPDCPGCTQHKAKQDTSNMVQLPGSLPAAPPVMPMAPQTTQTPATGAPARDPIAVIQTTKGVITIRLFRELAPNTVANFLDLARKGFYNGLVWHRVVPGFCIQTGCPKGDGSGSYVDPATNQVRYVNMESSPKLRHNAAGVVAMARFGNNPNSASSQFYITLGKHEHLDNRYAIFGGVVGGLDAVQRIAVGDRVMAITIQE